MVSIADVHVSQDLRNADIYLSFYNDQSDTHQLKLNSDGSTTFGGDVSLSTANADTILTIANTASGGSTWKVHSASSSSSAAVSSGDFLIRNGSTNVLRLGTNTNATFAGEILVPSGDYISWGTSGATSMEGSTVSNKIQFRTGSADRMIINNTGVGIGTTSPSSNLHVTGAPANGVYLSYLYNSGTHNSSHGLNVQTASSNIAAYGLRVNTGGDSNALAVMGTGDVGIGTATPASKLHVYSSAPEIRIQDGGDKASNASGFFTIYDHDSLMASFGVTDGGDMNVVNNAGEMIFTQNTDDGNINFNCDDGSGGVTTYMSLDGGDTDINVYKSLHMPDNVITNIGSGSDLQLWHNGTNSFITNNVLIIEVRN